MKILNQVLFFNILFISISVYFTKMRSSLRRPSFSKIFPISETYHWLLLGASKRFDKHNWTNIQAVTERQHYIYFGRQRSQRKQQKERSLPPLCCNLKRISLLYKNNYVISMDFSGIRSFLTKVIKMFIYMFPLLFC